MNVVLVTIDCLRRDRCGVYGHHRDTTPNLDALAQDGYLFDNAFSTGPGTTDSFPGILAGRLSAQTELGGELFRKHLPEGASTIASHFLSKGWNTAAVISNPRIGEHVGTDHGFETFHNLRLTSNETTDTSTSLLPEFAVGEKLYQLRERMRDFESLPYRYEIPFLAFRYYQYLTGWPSIRGERVVNSFLNTLAEQSTPFFAWTHLMDVHGPIHPRTVNASAFTNDRRFTQFRSHANRVSDIHDSEIETRYDSAVQYVDAQLGRIIDWLKSNDLWTDTALVVTADHGDALYDRGVYGHHAHYLYDELLSVPLVVHIPGHEGGLITHPFSLGWLHEIVAELCDVSDMDVPLTSSYESHFGVDVETDDVLLADSIDKRGHSVAARQGELKYVTHTDLSMDTTSTKVGPFGYYRLDRDPKERRSIHAPHDHLEQSANKIITNTKEFDDQNSGSNIDSTTLDQLKQLGYAEE